MRIHRERRKPRAGGIQSVALLILLLSVACGGDDGGMERNDLDSMTTARISIEGYPFEVWIADDDQEQALGLMHVEAEELAPTLDGATRGMLFVYPSDRRLSFWMRNTPTALDIAFIQGDGKIVRITTMQPFDTSTHSSGLPATYALEVLAGTFASLGIEEGDTADIP
jgi:uncharacterized membrane protein (UPF0127 family)